MISSPSRRRILQPIFFATPTLGNVVHSVTVPNNFMSSKQNFAYGAFESIDSCMFDMVQTCRQVPFKIYLMLLGRFFGTFGYQINGIIRRSHIFKWYKMALWSIWIKLLRILQIVPYGTRGS